MSQSSEDNSKLVNEIISFYESLGFTRKINDFLPKDKSFDPVNVLERDGQKLDKSNWWLDLSILTNFFAADAWFADCECDVMEINQVYVDVLNEWAEISHGAFSPVDIDESWESEEGPITITFKLDGDICELYPDFCDDYLDPQILEHINALIADSGRSFETSSPDQQMMVLCLTPQQKMAMIEERDFPFTERILERVIAEKPLVRNARL